MQVFVYVSVLYKSIWEHAVNLMSDD